MYTIYVCALAPGEVSVSVLAKHQAQIQGDHVDRIGTVRPGEKTELVWLNPGPATLLPAGQERPPPAHSLPPSHLVLPLCQLTLASTED